MYEIVHELEFCRYQDAITRLRVKVVLMMIQGFWALSVSTHMSLNAILLVKQLGAGFSKPCPEQYGLLMNEIVHILELFRYQDQVKRLRVKAVVVKNLGV